MDRSDRIKLLKAEYTQDDIGQWVETVTERDVYAQIGSVSASEFFAAGQNGFKPEYRLTMFRFDYEGERDAVIDGVRYSVYRTYIAKNDTIELYLERRAGDEQD